MPTCLSVSPSKPPTDPTEKGHPSVCLPTQASHLPQIPSNHESGREGPDFPYIQVTWLHSHLSPCFLLMVSHHLSTHPAPHGPWTHPRDLPLTQACKGTGCGHRAMSRKRLQPYPGHHCAWQS